MITSAVIMERTLTHQFLNGTLSRHEVTSAQYLASRARDATFEKLMDKYMNFNKFIAIQDLILSIISRFSQKLHLNRGAASFLSRSSEHDGLSSSCSIENLMGTVGNYSCLGAEEWFPNKKECNGENDPQGGFDAVDKMLKSSLNRLKLMRERISPASLGFLGCNISVNNAGNIALIRDLCLGGKVGVALYLRRLMIQQGFVPNVLTHNYILKGLCKNKDMAMAEMLIREMLEVGPPPNCVTYNIFIRGYCLINDIDRALSLFSHMDNNGVRPNRVTINILLHALCKRRISMDATRLLREIIDSEEMSGSNLITSTILMDSCVKNGDMYQAISIWNEMLRKNVELDGVAYNVFIRGLCYIGNMSYAYGYLCKMLKSGLLPDTYTYNTLIYSQFKEGNFDEAYYIYGTMLRSRVCPDRVTYKIIIEGLLLQGKVFEANKYFQHLLDLDKSLAQEPAVWNLIIDGYGRRGDVLGAISVKDQMVSYGVMPNVYTYNALINAQVKSGNVNGAYSIKEEMLLSRVSPDTVTYNLLIGAACNSFNIDYALRLHSEMFEVGCEVDLITYTELIRGYCATGNMKQAVDLFVKLLNSNLYIDDVPFLILIKKLLEMRKPDMALDVYQKWLTRSKTAYQ